MTEQNHMRKSIADNEFVDPEFGAMMVRHEDDFADYTYSGNRYYSAADTGEWFFVDQLQSYPERDPKPDALAHRPDGADNRSA